MPSRILGLSHSYSSTLIFSLYSVPLRKQQFIFSSNNLIGFSSFKIWMIRWQGFCLNHTFSIVAVQSRWLLFNGTNLFNKYNFSLSECIGCTSKLSSVHFLPKPYFIYFLTHFAFLLQTYKRDIISNHSTESMLCSVEMSHSRGKSPLFSTFASCNFLGYLQRIARLFNKVLHK